MYRFSRERDEQILKKGLASLTTDAATISGALYLTSRRLVFVGYIHGSLHADEKSVPLDQISEVRSGKTFLLIPNAIDITTVSNDHFRLLVRERADWLTAIRAVTSGRTRTPRHGEEA